MVVTATQTEIDLFGGTIFKTYTDNTIGVYLNVGVDYGAYNVDAYF